MHKDKLQGKLQGKSLTGWTKAWYRWAKAWLILLFPVRHAHKLKRRQGRSPAQQTVYRFYIGTLTSKSRGCVWISSATDGGSILHAVEVATQPRKHGPSRRRARKKRCVRISKQQTVDRFYMLGVCV